MVESKQHTAYEFDSAIHKIVKGGGFSAQQVYTIFSDTTDEDKNLLNTIAANKRHSFLEVIFHHGYWSMLYKSSVQEDAQYVGKSRTLVNEINRLQEWEESLSKLSKLCRDNASFKKVEKRLKRFPSEATTHVDAEGCNALYFACIAGREDLLRAIARAGASIHKTSKSKRSLLHITAICGHCHLIPVLQEIGLNIAIQASMTDSPVFSMRYGLLPEEHGLLPEEHMAQSGHVDCLKSLLAVLGRETVSTRCLILAAQFGNIPFITYLLTTLNVAYDNPDHLYGMTALHAAATSGITSTLQHLLSLESTTDDWIRQRDHRNRTILHHAVESGNKDMVTLVLKKAHELDTKLGKNGEQVRDLLIAQDYFHGNTLGYLIRGKDKGRKAWHFVDVHRMCAHAFVTKTKSGSVDVARYGKVIKSGWGEDPTDEENEFCKKNHDQRLKTPQLDTTALHLACDHEYEEIVHILLDEGNDQLVNIRDIFEMTAVHTACMRGNLEIIRALTAAKADFTMSMSHAGISYTPTEVARENTHTSVVNYITSASCLTLIEKLRQNLGQHLEKLTPERVQALRDEGVDVQSHVVDIARDMSIDINTLLIDIGTGPVLQETTHH